jgi:hypothetical protein
VPSDVPRVTFFTKFPKGSWNRIVGVNPFPRGANVGEFRKTRHPRNVKINKVLEVCFSGAGNSRISEAWNLRSLEFANMLSSGILIRQRSGVTSARKPRISTGDGPNFGELPIQESVEDPVRGSGVWTSTNRRRRKDQFGDLLKI